MRYKLTGLIILLLAVFTVGCAVAVPTEYFQEKTENNINVVWPNTFRLPEFKTIDKRWEQTLVCVCEDFESNCLKTRPPEVNITMEWPHATLFDARVYVDPRLDALRHEFVHWILHAQGFPQEKNMRHDSHLFDRCAADVRFKNPFL